MPEQDPFGLAERLHSDDRLAATALRGMLRPPPFELGGNPALWRAQRAIMRDDMDRLVRSFCVEVDGFGRARLTDFGFVVATRLVELRDAENVERHGKVSHDE